MSVRSTMGAVVRYAMTPHQNTSVAVTLVTNFYQMEQTAPVSVGIISVLLFEFTSYHIIYM